MIRFLFLTLMSAFFFEGCISKHSGGMVDGKLTWLKSTTTKREVVENWGNPDVINGNVWIWNESRLLGGKIKASYRMVGLTISRHNIVTIQHHLEFCPKGVLIDYKIFKASEVAGKWGIVPWDMSL